MTDQLATLKAAEAAGATIQAFTTGLDDGSTSYFELTSAGYWRDLEGPAQWSCHPSRYRVKVEDVA